ncbi:hypothetical protein [Paraburkholderia bannensis]|uniref:hypothetical protein n=1 Tax=Paraburkholderia bannensis TaxID=765414 RepID=UPI002ABE92A4|nr:hypothetical protein [Paraburkholderia bannensis]
MSDADAQSCDASRRCVMRLRLGIDARFERRRPAVHAAAHAATACVVRAAVVGAGVFDAAAMSASCHLHVDDMADRNSPHIMPHRFARVRAAHAEQRKHANEKKATQDGHQGNNAKLTLVMIAHRSSGNSRANARQALPRTK